MTDMELAQVAQAILEAEGEAASTFDGPSKVAVRGYTLLETVCETLPCGWECCGVALTAYVLLSPSGERIRVDI